MQIRNLPMIQECYSRIGVGLWVFRETTFSMSDANTVDSLYDLLYDAVAREVDWMIDSWHFVSET